MCVYSLFVLFFFANDYVGVGGCNPYSSKALGFRTTNIKMFRKLESSAKVRVQTYSVDCTKSCI